jgi:hypothetical protein
MSSTDASTFMEDLIALCEGAELGLAYGTNLFKGPKAKFPESAGPFVSLIRTGGLGAEGTHNLTDVPSYERPSAQIIARATNYEDAEDMAKNLSAALYPVQNQFVNGTWWRVLNVRSEPFDLPPDEKGRPRVAFNIDCVKRVSPATSI